MARWFAFLGLLISCFYLIKLVIELTNLFYPSSERLKLSTVLHKKKFEAFKKQSSESTRQLLTFLIIVIATFICGIYLFSTLTKRYKLNQLTKFGETKKVIITDIRRMGKGSKYSFFNFYFNDKKVSRRLYQKKGQNIGDTCLVIFSTDNPDVIEWVEDFDNTK